MQIKIKREKKNKGVLLVLSPSFPQIHKPDIFTEFLAFNEKLNEVAQALDEAVAHLLPIDPNQVPSQQDPTQDPLPHLVYNSDSEQDSDNEIDPDLPWTEVQDDPSFQL